MKCATLRRLLADGGPAALEGNRRAEDHLMGCDRCLAVLEAVAEMDRLLPELGKLDVADEVVERLLARPELLLPSGKDASATVGRFARLRARVNAVSPELARIHPLRLAGRVIDHARRERLRWGIVGVPAVILIGLLSVATMRLSDSGLTGPTSVYVVKQVKLKQEPGEDKDISTEAERERRIPGRVMMSGGEAGAGGLAAIRVPNEGQPTTVADRVESKVVKAPASEPEPIRPEGLVLGYPDAPPAEHFGEAGVVVTGSLIPRADLTALSPVVVASPPISAKVEAGVADEEVLRPSNQRVGADGRAVRGNDSRQPSVVRAQEQKNLEHNQGFEDFRKKIAQLEDQVGAFRDLGDAESARQLEEQAEVLKGQYEEVSGKRFRRTKEDDALDQRNSSLRGLIVRTDTEALTEAERFLATREQIEGLEFREARGYWANTYVPGDRTLRSLRARLDRAADAGGIGTLHEASHQITQPFDSPEGAALAVYLHSDRNGLEARERMLVQVGLKGTARRSGRRPAMNVGLVLDLRGEVAPAVGTSMRALLQAFADAAELGDRFSVTVAGRPGGTIVRPGDLRHGPLTVALAEVFGDEPSGEVLSLDRAAAEALATVRADDDPNAPLGSSALVVITAQPLGSHAARLGALAHESAVDGVPWSVIGIDRKIDLAELDALVLAGQGNRRLLTSAGDAEALVGRELAAVSRVVARAVRLRIRLAPGVQLVDVIGSRRLDEDHAQQVRDAEQAIDQRLSRNLGIQTDRGLDEERIQIVIPSFYADGAHVVLLDVVAPGPGPVADVTVRYKDVVHMKNGIARAHLRVGRAVSPAGPLERNVLANLLAAEVASNLDNAADRVAVGDVAAAGTILSDTLDLVRGAVALVDGLSQNADLDADAAMLSGYIEALSRLSSGTAGQLELAADSLRYAGRLKILPPPMSDDESDPQS